MLTILIMTQNCRIVVPILWNSRFGHLLSDNKDLAHKILESSFQRVKNDKEKSNFLDQLFKEQERLGILERIDNLNQFLVHHPECNFLPHMGVFKLDRSTSK